MSAASEHQVRRLLTQRNEILRRRIAALVAPVHGVVLRDRINSATSSAEKRGTTQRYIDLAGVVFADEVRRLSEWYGETGTKNRYEVAADEAEDRMESRIAAVSD